MPRHLLSPPATPGAQRRAVVIGLALVVGLAALVVSASAASGKTSASSDSGGISAVFDPSDWYLTLPSGKKGDPDTVEVPILLEEAGPAWDVPVPPADVRRALDELIAG